MLRTRNRGSFSGLTTYQRVVSHYPINGNTSPATVTPSTINVVDASGKTESITDMVTKSFRKVQSEGGISNNPMWMAKETRSGSCSGLTATYDQGKNPDPGWRGTDVWSGDFVAGRYGPPALPPIDEALVAHLSTLAATAARAGVEAPAAQGMVYVAELRKTLNMLRNPLSGLQRFIKDRRKWEPYRKKGFRQAQQARSRTAREAVQDGASAAASSWLEARFGWRPFLMETSAILEQLKKEHTSPRKTSRGSQSRTVTSTVQETRTQGLVSVTFQVTTEIQYIVRSGILYESTMDLRDALGFRWSDLPAAAWELIPFSFVADWFVNVGDTIQAMTPKVGIRHLAEFESIRIIRKVTRVPISASYSGWTVTSHPAGSHVRIYETYERRPRVSQAAFTFESDITQALKNGRVFDAAALIYQLFPKSKKRT